MTNTQIQKFQKIVYNYYNKNKRSFPWRKTKNPYFIMVSEIMLQQTQTDRVVPKYEDFITTFPTIETLAKSPLKKVLQKWQGLGYNRRAFMLHKASQEISRDYAGILPETKELLETLPGIGPYTAGAIVAFSHNTPIVIIETNIRTVFIHHFFKNKNDVSDKEILIIIKQTLDTKNPRKWYSALMDYGSYLKKTNPNPSRKSSHHTKQKPFKGSDREIRGDIIKKLTTKSATKKELSKYVEKHTKDTKRISSILKKLLTEDLIKNKKDTFFIS